MRRYAQRVFGGIRNLQQSKALFLLAIVSCVAWTGIGLIGPVLPLLGLRLNATPFELGLPVSVFAFTSLVGSLLAGALLDRWGLLIFLSVGILIYGIGHFLIAGASTIGLLILFRGLAGLGDGAALVGTRTYVARIATNENRAFANGLISAAESGGRVIGPAASGLLVALGSERTPFLFVGITGGVAFLISLLLPRQPAAPSNAAGAADEGQPARLPTRLLATLLVAQFAFLGGYGAIFAVYPPFATRELGWSTTEVGLLISAFGLGAIALGPFLSKVADRSNKHLVALSSLTLVAVWLVISVTRQSMPAIFVSAFVAGGGFTAYNGVWYALLTADLPRRLQAKAMAVVLAVSQLGIVAGSTAATLVWQRVALSPALGSVLAMVAIAAAGMLASAPRDSTRGSVVALQQP